MLKTIGACKIMLQCTFCIMGQRVNLNSEFKPLGEDEVKASFQRRKLFKLDPKPNELIMNK